MRKLPEDDEGEKELDRLACEPWMIEYLKLNPDYPHWGPGDDYMAPTNKEHGGWNSSLEVESWKAFGPWSLDDYNECVHFYFELNRLHKVCVTCGRSGYNPATKEIADTFYDFEGTGQRWSDKITQDEVDALIAEGRLRAWLEGEWKTVSRTAEEVNAANRGGAKYSLGASDLMHDAFNINILIKTRAKRLGVYGLCPMCEGEGYQFTQPQGQMNLVVWMLHPRKGAARGVRILNLSKKEAMKARQWLSKAAERNAARFAKVQAL